MVMPICLPSQDVYIFILGGLSILLGLILFALAFILPIHRKKLAYCTAITFLIGVAGLILAATYATWYPPLLCATSGGGEITPGFCPQTWRCEQPDPLAGAACTVQNASLCKYRCSCSPELDNQNISSGICTRHSGFGCRLSDDGICNCILPAA